MPRRSRGKGRGKSGAEDHGPPKVKSLFDDDDSGAPVPEKLKVNEPWAAKYDERKRRQALGRARDLGINLDSDQDDDDASTSESEDEDGEALTAKKESEILNAWRLIRNRDPRVYDPEAKFYSSSDEGEDDKEGDGAKHDGGAEGAAGTARKEKKKLTAKDVLREQLVKAAEEGREDAFDEDSDVEEPKPRHLETAKVSALAYDDEQRALRAEFAAAASKAGDGAGESDGEDGSGSDDSDASGAGGLLKVKQRVKRQPVKVPVEEVKDAGDKFLLDFVLNRRWIPKDEDDSDDEGGDGDGSRVDVDEDAEALEAADAFEAKYNFRFEEAGGTSIIGHSRVVHDSMRRKDEKRKKERERKKLRQLMEKEAEEQELRRLKNMKRAELKSRLMKIQGVAGTKTLDPVANTLDGDFDPEEHDRRMREVFNDDYYADDDEELPEDIMAGLDEDLGEFAHTDDGEGDGGEGAWGSDDDDENAGDDGGHEGPRDVDVEQHEEMLKLHAEGKAGGVRTRFQYRRVAPNDFGLEAVDILGLDDSSLNQFVSLRKLAPYRDREYRIEEDRKSKRLARIRREAREAAAQLAEELAKQEARQKDKKKSKKNKKKGHKSGDSKRDAAGAAGATPAGEEGTAKKDKGKKEKKDGSSAAEKPDGASKRTRPTDENPASSPAAGAGTEGGDESGKRKRKKRRKVSARKAAPSSS